MYTCPMHSEIQQDHEGRCPLCGMKLVQKSATENDTHQSETTTENSYIPLIVIICLIFLTSIATSRVDSFDMKTIITNFMIGFFLVFGGFKMMDLKGFAQGYATYDLVAQRVFLYGYIYPFIELFFAFAMIFQFQIRTILILEIIVMVLSGIGVATKLLRREKFQCACLGTFLKVPLTKVTLIEDFGMAVLGVILLLVI